MGKFILNINLLPVFHSTPYSVVDGRPSNIYCHARSKITALQYIIATLYIYTRALATTSAQNCGCKDETLGMKGTRDAMCLVY